MEIGPCMCRAESGMVTRRPDPRQGHACLLECHPCAGGASRLSWSSNTTWIRRPSSWSDPAIGKGAAGGNAP